jgi:DNA-binding XRE family transcriptional regulator
MTVVIGAGRTTRPSEDAVDRATIVVCRANQQLYLLFNEQASRNDGGMPKRIGADIKRKSSTPRQLFGFAVTRLRTHKEKSQSEVASAVGCAESYLRSIEQGKENFTFDLEYAIVGYFGMLPMSRFWAYAEELAAHESVPFQP